MPRYIPLALIDPASQQIPSRLNKSENIIDARNNASVVRARATGKTKKTHRYLAAKMHTHRATWLTRRRFFVEKNNARRWYVVEFQGNKTRDHFDQLVWQDRQRLWVSKFSMKFVMNAVFEKIFDPQFFLFFFHNRRRWRSENWGWNFKVESIIYFVKYRRYVFAIRFKLMKSIFS